MLVCHDLYGVYEEEGNTQSSPAKRKIFHQKYLTKPWWRGSREISILLGLELWKTNTKCDKIFLFLESNQVICHFFSDTTNKLLGAISELKNCALDGAIL